MYVEGTQVNEKSQDLDNFLRKYGGLDFDNVKFRPGAKFTTGFGLDSVFSQFRVHPAIDRGSAGDSPIYAPFDLTHIELNDKAMNIWGYQLRLHTLHGFEVRVAHVEHLPRALKRAIKNNEPVEAGTYLCNASDVGKSTGVHTHTEVVSYGSVNPLLEELLEIKTSTSFIRYYLDDIKLFLKKINSTEDPVKAMDAQYNAKKITFLSDHLCRRRDYITGKSCTFYDSQALFGM